jgi:biopolymer transport protein ExbB/TolQ
MSETVAITVALGLVATLFGMLTGVLAWMGAKVISRLDAVVDKLDKVAGELHARINGIDNRLSIVETEIGHKVDK